MNIKWREYTWYSRLGAVILFLLVVPTLTFYIGTQYEKTVYVLSDANNYPIVSNHYLKPLQLPPSTTTITATTTVTTITTSTTTVPTTALTITTLTPSSGVPQTEVTIKGSGFDLNNNLIMFGESHGNHHINGLADNVIAQASSTDGRTLIFTVPATGPSGIICSSSNHCVAISSIRLSPGVYPVSVSNKNGTSTSLSFTLTR